MASSQTGTVTPDGHHYGPGVIIPCSGSAAPSSPNLLPLPPSVLENADERASMRLDRIQLEYARDVAKLQMRAYGEALKAIVAGDVPKGAESERAADR